MRGAGALVVALMGLLCVPVLDSGGVADAGQRRAREARPKARAVIWRDPGRVERLDFRYGPGGRAGVPAPPFRFIEEDTDGSNAKIKVRDAKGRRWSVKWDTGGEANAETIATRIAWAAGYFVEPNYFVERGRIHGVRDLKRADKFVGPDGSFRDARFELKYETVAEQEDKESWAWDVNPFSGSRELNGLKIVSMLVSNWDNKDVRDARRGSNTAVHFVRTSNGVEARYLITDWGGSMGKWGGFFTRDKWNCDEFYGQTAKFVEIEDDGDIDWGFSGQHSGTFKEDITIDDIRWVMKYLGRITDAQLRAGVAASGASRAEVACYQRALRGRIEQLRAIARRGRASAAYR